MALAGMRTWVALGAAVVALGACSSGGNTDAVTERVPLPEGIAKCADVYNDKAVVDPDTFGDACAQGEQMVVPRAVVLRCTDKKSLYWNKFAWGYEAKAMTLIDPDAAAHNQVPYEQAMECLHKDASDQQAAINDGLQAFENAVADEHRPDL